MAESSITAATQGVERRRISPKQACVVLSILVCELCERLTYYSVVANMVLFCTSILKFSSPDAATVNLVFAGVVYFIPVIGGYVADALLGRYRTILGATLIYLVGLILLPVACIDFQQAAAGNSSAMTKEERRGCFLTGLVFIAIGTGGIKANVAPFGALQVEDLGKEAVQTFFNWFYWFVNVGALLAYSAVAYLQQNISWAWGFSVPLFSMALAIIVFVSARGNYQHKPPGESVLTTVFAVYKRGCGGHFDSIRKKNGGHYDDYTVDGALSVLRVLPVFLLMIFYWAIYSQMSTTFILQAERMDVKIGQVALPAAMLNIFDTIIILVLIPLVDRLVYPAFSRLGHPLTHLQRIGIGLLLAGASVVVAGIVEINRKKYITDYGFHVQTLGNEKFNASSMSVFVQIPQYCLVGASEVFASVTGLEFAFTQAPVSMQGLLSGLFLMTSGLGSFVADAILRIVVAATKSDPWFPNDINNGKTENLFFLLGGLMFLNFIGFVFVARWYKYLPPSDESEEETMAVNYDGYTQFKNEAEELKLTELDKNDTISYNRS